MSPSAPLTPAVDSARAFVEAVRDGDADRAWRLTHPAYRERLTGRHMQSVVSILAGEDERRRLAGADDPSPEATQLRELVRAWALEALAAADGWAWSPDPGQVGPDIELVTLCGPWAADRWGAGLGVARPALAFRMRRLDGEWLLAGLDDDALGSEG